MKRGDALRQQLFNVTANVKLSLPTPYIRHVVRAEVSFHPFSTSALDGSKWSTSNPGLFACRERITVPTEQEDGWAPESSMDGLIIEFISPFPGFESRNVQPVASRYTDYAIPTP
jgi:hypothetical protein